MSISITRADLATSISEAEVTRFSRQDDSNVTTAIAMAWDKARSAALNWFTAASWDALDSSTLPYEAKFYIVWDAVDILSAGQSRPDEYQKKADEAAKWRSFLAGDTVRCFDSVLTRIAGTANDRVRISGPDELVFDRGTTTSPSNYGCRDRRI